MISLNLVLMSMAAHCIFSTFPYNPRHMSVRMRHNKSQTGQHRAHKNAKPKTLSVDTKTKSTHLRHRLDLATGHYRGRKFRDMVSEVEKKQAKAAA